MNPPETRNPEPGTPNLFVTPNLPAVFSFALPIIASLWVLTLLLAPLALERGGGAAAVSAAVYEGAGLICHQRPERSFHLAGVPMPVCARCSGLYCSGAAGALLAWSRRRKGVVRPRSTRLVLLVAALPTALSVAGELAGVIPSSNSSRMIAALPLGAAAGWIFVRSLRSEAEPERPAVAL